MEYAKTLVYILAICGGMAFLNRLRGNWPFWSRGVYFISPLLFLLLCWPLGYLTALVVGLGYLAWAGPPWARQVALGNMPQDPPTNWFDKLTDKVGPYWGCCLRMSFVSPFILAVHYLTGTLEFWAIPIILPFAFTGCYAIGWEEVKDLQSQPQIGRITDPLSLAEPLCGALWGAWIVVLLV